MADGERLEDAGLPDTVVRSWRSLSDNLRRLTPWLLLIIVGTVWILGFGVETDRFQGTHEIHTTSSGDGLLRDGRFEGDLIYTDSGVRLEGNLTAYLEVEGYFEGTYDGTFTGDISPYRQEGPTLVARNDVVTVDGEEVNRSSFRNLTSGRSVWQINGLLSGSFAGTVRTASPHPLALLTIGLFGTVLLAAWGIRKEESVRPVLVRTLFMLVGTGIFFFAVQAWVVGFAAGSPPVRALLSDPMILGTAILPLIYTGALCLGWLAGTKLRNLVIADRKVKEAKQAEERSQRAFASSIHLLSIVPLFPMVLVFYLVSIFASVGSFLSPVPADTGPAPLLALLLLFLVAVSVWVILCTGLYLLASAIRYILSLPQVPSPIQEEHDALTRNFFQKDRSQFERFYHLIVLLPLLGLIAFAYVSGWPIPKIFESLLVPSSVGVVILLASTLYTWLWREYRDAGLLSSENIRYTAEHIQTHLRHLSLAFPLGMLALLVVFGLAVIPLSPGVAPFMDLSWMGGGWWQGPAWELFFIHDGWLLKSIAILVSTFLVVSAFFLLIPPRLFARGSRKWLSLGLIILGILITIVAPSIVDITDPMAWSRLLDEGPTLGESKLVSIVALLGLYGVDSLVRDRAKVPCQECDFRNPPENLRCGVCGTALPHHQD